jgi:RimJ/RimL family protein N-acetyltransferase
MRAYVETALADQRRGRSLPFAIVDRARETVIGSTRFMDIAPEHWRLEIGATWLTPAHQRTGANVDSKLLMLGYAFEVARAQKVGFKTEVLNDQSRRAILALGAVQEGVLRRHLLSDAGRRRDMAYFSILDDEWPAVRERNRARLGQRRSSGE